jgi:hypothetical protein
MRSSQQYTGNSILICGGDVSKLEWLSALSSCVYFVSLLGAVKGATAFHGVSVPEHSTVGAFKHLTVLI